MSLRAKNAAYCCSVLSVLIAGCVCHAAKLYWKESEGWIDEISKEVVLQAESLKRSAVDMAWVRLPIAGRSDVNAFSRYEDGLGYVTPWSHMNLQYLEKGDVDARPTASGGLVVYVSSGSNDPIRDARWAYLLTGRPIRQGGLLKIVLSSDCPAELLVWGARKDEMVLNLSPETATYLIPLTSSPTEPLEAVTFSLWSNQPQCRVVIERLEWGNQIAPFQEYVAQAAGGEFELIQNHRIYYHRRGGCLSAEPFAKAQRRIEELAAVKTLQTAQQAAQQIDDALGECYVHLSYAAEWLADRRRMEHLEMKMRTLEKCHVAAPADAQSHLQLIKQELNRTQAAMAKGILTQDLPRQTAWRLDRVHQLVEPLFLKTGKSVHYAGRRWFKPDGTPTAFVGNEITRNMHFWELHPSSFSRFVFKESYFRLLAALGFTGVRVVVTYDRLEPEQGVIHEGYWDQCKRAIELADKYGLMCAIDLHWPHPKWFIKGPQNNPNGQPGAHWSNIFQNPDALLWTWSEIGKRLKPYRHIAVIEVPSNEAVLGSEDIQDVNQMVGIQTQPVLMQSWNDFIKTRYKNLENLKNAWTVTSSKGQTVYSVDASEEWGKIRPFGYQLLTRQGDEFADNVNPSSYGSLFEKWHALVGNELHLMNPRLLDYIDWASQYRSGLCQRIAEAVKPNVPQAAFMEQYIIGDIWEPSPVPLNYRALSQITGPDTCLGTHYEMGGWAAIKSRALGLPCYDSEQVMDHRQLFFVRAKILEQGFSAHNDLSNHPVGPRIFANNECMLKNELGWLALGSDFYSQAVLNAPQIDIAVIENTCKAVLGMDATSRVHRLLTDAGEHVDVLESLFIGKTPAVLNKYKVLVADINYLQPDVLELLLQSDKTVILYGKMDEYRWQNGQRTIDLLVKHQWVKDADLLERISQLSQMDISGQWKFKYDLDSQNQPTDAERPTAANFAGISVDDSDWQMHPVPGKWKEYMFYQSQSYFIGDGWYRTQVMIPADWEGYDLELQMTAIDDYDWTYFNGVNIGHTGQGTPSWWTAPRRYRIPASLVKPGQINLIAIRVTNDVGEGGIIGDKVMLYKSGQRTVCRLQNPLGNLPQGAEKPVTLIDGICLNRKALCADVSVIAASGDRALLVRKGNHYLYNTDVLNSDGAFDVELLRDAFTASGLKIRAESQWGLMTAQFDMGYAVVNDSDQAKTLSLDSVYPLQPLLEMVLEPNPINPDEQGKCVISIPPRTGQFYRYVKQ